MAILVDLMTWFVLVPMLMAHPDPKRVEAWKALMFCFSSYMVRCAGRDSFSNDLWSTFPGFFLIQKFCAKYRILRRDILCFDSIRYAVAVFFDTLPTAAISLITYTSLPLL